MKISEICGWLDKAVPLALQESYDNSGLQTGFPDDEAAAALLTVDVTEEVIDEAVTRGCNLVISHHPLIFSPVKRILPSHPNQRTLISAIKNNISVYSAHTSLDSVNGGVSHRMAARLGLTGVKVLAPVKGKLVKLVTFVPPSHLNSVSDAVFAAGAGNIGNYDSCAFNLRGEGTFRGNDQSSPFTGKKGELHTEPEVRFETILPSYSVSAAVKALLTSHPYEEPAFDLYPLLNEWNQTGMGVTGLLEREMSQREFLKFCKKVFGADCIRHSPVVNRKVKKAALCGGAGASLLSDAIASGADAFVTADVKYHQFAEAAGEILLIDAGHYETEKFSVEILYELLIKKFPNFALRFSETGTNPINCF